MVHGFRETRQRVWVAQATARHSTETMFFLAAYRFVCLVMDGLAQQFEMVQFPSFGHRADDRLLNSGVPGTNYRGHQSGP